MQTGSAANLDKPPCRRGGPYVFKPLDDPLVLSRMTRPGADVREAKPLQELSVELVKRAIAFAHSPDAEDLIGYS